MRTSTHKALTVTLAGTLAFGIVGCGASPADTHNAGPVAQAFENAAAENGVPPSILMAIGYVESRWQMVTPKAGAEAMPRWGIMGLAEGGTLDQAAALTGESQATLEHDVAGNVSGAAGVLAEYATEILGSDYASQTDPSLWHDVIAEYSGYGPDVAAAYADDVLATIQNGAGMTLSDGESLELTGTDPTASTTTGTTAPTPVTGADDPNVAQLLTADPANFTTGRDCNVSVVVIHETEGSYYSALAYGRDPASGFAVQYVVRSKDGQVTQMVPEADAAYNAGPDDCYAIGIEHEGYAGEPAWQTEAMYQASAKLVCDITKRFDIPIDRKHIIGHDQVPGSTHADPGSSWNWDHYMALIEQDCGKAP